MALKLTDATTRIVSASLGSPSTGTAAFWIRRTSSGTDPIFFRFGDTTTRYWEFHTSTPTFRRSGAAPTNPFTVSAGDWAYLGITKNGGTLGFYGFTDVTAETVTAIESAYLPTTLTSVEVGDVAAAYGASMTDMEIAHLRVWNSVLTTAQMNTEKNSATPVITSGCLLAASLDSALTAQTGSDLSVVTGTGYTFTANAPSSLSGGASTVPPSLLATRQHIAFAQTF